MPVGSLTEIAGPPGVGKTQLLQQLAVSCVLPVELGGLDGECLYVDTEGSVVADRFYQMVVSAVALVKSIAARAVVEGSNPTGMTTGCTAPHRGHVGSVSESEGQQHDNLRRQRPNASKRDRDGEAKTTLESSEPIFSTSTNMTTWTTRNDEQTPVGPTTPLVPLAGSFTAHAAMQRVHYLRVTDVTMLLAVLYSIPTWLAERTTKAGGSCPVRMILIDSIAALFRAGLSDGSDRSSSPTAASSHYGSKSSLWQRTRLLYSIGERLQSYAAQHQLAVIVSNQITTRSVLLPLKNAPPSAVSARESIRQTHSRQSFLVPALGNTWAYHVCTRVLLSFHHYDLLTPERPSETENIHPCREDVAISTVARESPLGDGTTLPSEGISQHRVARLIKSPASPVGECCFAITRKGVRDVASSRGPPPR